jgi:hypothetical protein
MKRSEDVNLLIERAEEDAGLRRPGKKASAPPPAPQREKRYVFNGDTPRSTAGYARRLNRRAVQRHRSTFGIIVTLAALGVCAVLYIGNIVAVNRLAHEVERLRAHYNDLLRENQILAADIDRKSGLERVTTIAGDKLGLVNPKEPAQLFDVDEERERSMAESGE